MDSMEITPQTAGAVNPTPPTVLYLAVAPSWPTCPRRNFPTLDEALAWGRRMSVFYKACFAVFHVEGDCLTLVQLVPPFPRDGEVRS
jgi:hypothetical protein